MHPADRREHFLGGTGCIRGGAQHRRVYRSRTNAVRANILGRKIERDGARDSQQRMFRRNIRHRIIDGGETLYGRHNHDGSATGCEHGRDGIFRRMKTAFHVDIHGLVPDLGRGGNDVAVALNSGVADQNMKSTIALHCGGDRSFHLRLDRDITGKIAGCVACLLERGNRLFPSFRVAIQYRHASAQFAQLPRRCLTNPGSAPGHDCNFAFHLHPSVILSRLSIQYFRSALFRYMPPAGRKTSYANGVSIRSDLLLLTARYRMITFNA